MTAQDKALIRAGHDRDNWRLHGRTYDSQRFSPLTQIGPQNVPRLEFVRTLHTGVANSFEDTLLEVDGVLYIVTATDHVEAFDAATGKSAWWYQEVPHDLWTMTPALR